MTVSPQGLNQLGDLVTTLDLGREAVTAAIKDESTGTQHVTVNNNGSGNPT